LYIPAKPSGAIAAETNPNCVRFLANGKVQSLHELLQKYLDIRNKAGEYQMEFQRFSSNITTLNLTIYNYDQTVKI
jgi:hypothetical protein